MSKQCAICGEKIQMMSEYNLSKDHKNTKICFTCYEYVATAMKGNTAAAEKLKTRYKDDIAEKVTRFIDSLTQLTTIEETDEPRKDEFMKLMGNDLSKDTNKEKSAPKNNIIKLDKLTEAKHDRLIRIKILSSILMFIFLVGGLLLSFFIATQGYGAMFALVTAILSIGFALVFSFIKTFLSIVLDE